MQKKRLLNLRMDQQKVLDPKKTRQTRRKSEESQCFEKQCQVINVTCDMSPKKSREKKMEQKIFEEIIVECLPNLF